MKETQWNYNTNGYSIYSLKKFERIEGPLKIIHIQGVR